MHSQTELLLHYPPVPPHEHSLSLSLSLPPKPRPKMPRIARSTSDTVLPGPPDVSPFPRPSPALKENVGRPLRYRSDSVDKPAYHLAPVPYPNRYPDRIVTLSFLAEGAANAVFQINPYVDGDETAKRPDAFFFLMDCRHDRWTPVPHDKVRGKVLRISKGVPKTLPFRDIVHGFNTVIRPLFKAAGGEDGIGESEREPCRSHGTTGGSTRAALKSHGRALTAKLHASRHNGVADGHTKSSTPSKSYESFLMDDEGVDFNGLVARHLHTLMHGSACSVTGSCDRVPQMERRGILLPDMSSVPGKFLTVELKPKWLAQSPTAPRDAFKCRTCALQARRTSLGKSPPISYICPLQLVAGNEKAIEKFLRPRLMGEIKGNEAVDVEALLRRTTEYLANGPGHELLQFLHKLQTEHDDAGVTRRKQEGDEIFDQRLRVAMTLRDCSLFIRVPYEEGEDAHIEGKLGDLDYKSHDKIKDWMMKETALINGGWYTKLEKTGGGENKCAIAEGWRKDCPWYV